MSASMAAFPTATTGRLSERSSSDRELSAALMTSGKPFLNVELWRLFQLFSAINQATEPRA